MDHSTATILAYLNVAVLTVALYIRCTKLSFANPKPSKSMTETVSGVQHALLSLLLTYSPIAVGLLFVNELIKAAQHAV